MCFKEIYEKSRFRRRRSFLLTGSMDMLRDSGALGHASRQGSLDGFDRLISADPNVGMFKRR